MSTIRAAEPRLPDGANESAFPVPDNCGCSSGISTRDYFAAAAITGLMTIDLPDKAAAADCAYKMADAMLARRAKP